jgi:SHS2 domain-containing protein
MPGRFEEIEHTADIAIRVWGAGVVELFTNAAYGMACQLADVEAIPLETEREIEVEAEDLEMLLVEWLSELLYLGERDNVVFAEFNVLELTSGRLRAVVRGGPVEGYQRHIKAVTFSDLDIRQTHGEYETVVVFDV